MLEFLIQWPEIDRILVHTGSFWLETFCLLYFKDDDNFVAGCWSWLKKFGRLPVV
jgi:hypothetical protein